VNSRNAELVIGKGQSSGCTRLAIVHDAFPITAIAGIVAAIGGTMDRKTAELVVGVVNRCIDELIETLAVVEKSVPPAEYEKYKRAVGRVINAFDIEVVDRVAVEFPDLKPKDEEEPDGEPPVLKS
jgi:hypothetical protein